MRSVGKSNILLAFCLKTGLKQSLSVEWLFPKKGSLFIWLTRSLLALYFQAGWAAWAAEAWFGQLLELGVAA